MATLAASPFDLLVVDYSSDGTQRGALRRDDLDRIRAGRPGRKVLAYLSIGEAESYRFYFRSSWVTGGRESACLARPARGAPRWLAFPNPDYCDNFAVRFWERSWQRVLFGVRRGRSKSYLDRIIDAGFDGVYLDIVDGFRYWDSAEGDGTRPRAATDMSRLVVRLASYARRRAGPSFAIVPQNGADILAELSRGSRARYLAAIDGIGAEDSFFFGSRDVDNPFAPQTRTLQFLDTFRAAGKPVLAIDYLTHPTAIEQFRGAACERGYVPQVATRQLDSLTAHLLRGCAS